MHSNAEKSTEPKNQQLTAEPTQTGGLSKASPSPFVRASPPPSTQLKEMANSSPQVRQLLTLQHAANRSALSQGGVVQRAATFAKGDENYTLQQVHEYLIEHSNWYGYIEKTQAWDWLNDFAVDDNGAYDLDNLETLDDAFYDYYTYHESQDYQEDEVLDRHDEQALDYLEKRDQQTQKSIKGGRTKREEAVEEEDIDGAVDKMNTRKQTPSWGDIGLFFQTAASTALKAFSTGGKKTKDTRYAEIMQYSQKALTVQAPKNFSDGKPQGFSSTYGLVPTERGDFTKLQYAILNDVVYETGNTALLVEWSRDREDANRAQYDKINALLKMLYTFKDAKGKLMIFAVLNTVDEFNEATMMNYLVGGRQSPVLSGGEAFDKEIFDKGKKFWEKHSVTGGEKEEQRRNLLPPFLVIWFNRTKMTAEYDEEEDDPKVKAHHLREMRHRTNTSTMAAIINQYKSGRRIIFAGDKGTSEEELGLTPYLDLRESWKLPGHDTILSQDETFDELAAASAQEVVHIGFRSGRLESLVMQPRQRVVMLENSMSVIGNMRANRYYAYSGRGKVFNPEGMEALHVDPHTLELAGKLKQEEIQEKDPMRYGIPKLPEAIPEESLSKHYPKYLRELDRVMSSKHDVPNIDDSLSQIVGQLVANLELELPKLGITWSMTFAQNRGPAFKTFRNAFKWLVDKHKANIVEEIRDTLYMPREAEVKTVGLAIFNTVEEQIDDLDKASSSIDGVLAVGGMPLIKADLLAAMEQLKQDTAMSLMKDGIMKILALQAYLNSENDQEE